MSEYIYYFETEADFNQARNNNYSEPWVSYTEGKGVDYNKPNHTNVPFTIEAIQDGTNVYFCQSSFAEDNSFDPLKVEVSTNNGETWTEVTAAPASNNTQGAILAELDRGEKVFIRGRNEAYGFYEEMMGDAVENCNFYADKPCYVYGNIMSLIGGDDFASIREVEEYAFACFFSDFYEWLNWSWVLSKEGEELLLPATTLAESCYSRMFANCTSLAAAPKLPATTLADSCYCNMFKGCTSLTAAPALPAMTLVGYCYSSMFSGCTSLTVAPELSATTLVSNCYSAMFANCTNLTAAPELPATTLVTNCYSSMFYNCTNLFYIKAMFTTTPGTSYTSNWVKNVKATGTFVKNSAATWTTTGVDGVPTGWTIETATA